eukprot:2965808-Amphidinium_carterae.2
MASVSSWLSATKFTNCGLAVVGSSSVQPHVSTALHHSIMHAQQMNNVVCSNLFYPACVPRMVVVACCQAIDDSGKTSNTAAKAM